jgi:1-acyl-sn-glycerol-3-phosphate acyltransferase
VPHTTRDIAVSSPSFHAAGICAAESLTAEEGSMPDIRHMFRSARALVRVLSLAAWTELVLLALRIDARARGERVPVALRYGQIWASYMLRALGVRVELDGHVPGERVLVVANHRSYIDIPVLLAALPCAFLAKREVQSWPLFGRAATRIHTVFVKRECRESRRSARLRAGELLSQGVSFAAFPEGTTSGGPGVQSFHRGLFQLAEERGFPVLPVAICYSAAEDNFVDEAEFLPHLLATCRKPVVRVQVRFGPLLRPDTATDLCAQAQGWIESALARLDASHAAPASLPARLPAAPAPTGAFAA